MRKHLGAIDVKVVASIISVIITLLTVVIAMHESSHKDDMGKINRNYQMVVAAHREINSLKDEDTMLKVEVAKLKMKVGI
jgi:cell division protein FtsB